MIFPYGKVIFTGPVMARCAIAIALWLILLLQIVDCHHTNEPPEVSTDTTSHSISWNTDTLGYYPSYLNDIWGGSATSVYAVGKLKTGGSRPVQFVAHFNGAQWATVQDDSLGWWIAAGELTAIHGISDTAIFVVGDSYNGDTSTGFVGHWDGRSWVNISPVSSPALLAIWVRGPHDVYVGGVEGAIFHYGTTGWNRLQSETQLDIHQISGLPDGQVYAIACKYFDSYAGSVLLRLDSSNVVPVHVFAVGRMFGVWAFSESNLYVAGEGLFRSTSTGTWTEVITPVPSVTLYSVAGTGENDMMIVGAYGAAAHWSGASWRFYEQLYDRSSVKSYMKAFIVGANYYLVGTTGTSAMMSIGSRTTQ
jgi:hypothetical protein